jgi:hypothetical protein
MHFRSVGARVRYGQAGAARKKQAAKGAKDKDDDEQEDEEAKTGDAGGKSSAGKEAGRHPFRDIGTMRSLCLGPFRHGLRLTRSFAVVLRRRREDDSSHAVGTARSARAETPHPDTIPTNAFHCRLGLTN